MPIPVGLHPGSGGIHNIEKQYGIWGGIDGDVFSKMLQNINSMTIRTKKWIRMEINNVSKKKWICFLKIFKKIRRNNGRFT